MSHLERGPLATYNSLTDRHLAGYFANTRMRKHLRKSGLITVDGEIIDGANYRLNMARKDHKKHVKDLLAQAIVHKTLDIERLRQMEIKKRLEEIAKLETVKRVRDDTKKKGDERLLPMLSPRGTGRKVKYRPISAPDQHSGRKSSARTEDNYKNAAAGEDGDKKLLAKPEIDAAKLEALSTDGLRDYAIALDYDEMRRKDYNPYTVPQIPLPPQTKRTDIQTAKIERMRAREKEKAMMRPAKRPASTIGVSLYRPEPVVPHPSQLQSLAIVTMKYHGYGLHLVRDELDPRQEILIDQQHCGGNTRTVFKEMVSPGSSFQFQSLRHRGYPFSLSIYIDGKIDSRISTCCEFGYKMPARIGGRMGTFSLIKVGGSGAMPCFRCRAGTKPSPPKTPKFPKKPQKVIEEVVVIRTQPPSKRKPSTPSPPRTEKKEEKAKITSDSEGERKVSKAKQDEPPPAPKKKEEEAPTYEDDFEEEVPETPTKTKQPAAEPESGRKIEGFSSEEEDLEGDRSKVVEAEKAQLSSSQSSTPEPSPRTEKVTTTGDETTTISKPPEPSFLAEGETDDGLKVSVVLTSPSSVGHLSDEDEEEPPKAPPATEAEKEGEEDQDKRKESTTDEQKPATAMTVVAQIETHKSTETSDSGTEDDSEDSRSSYSSSFEGSDSSVESDTEEPRTPKSAGRKEGASVKEKEAEDTVKDEESKDEKAAADSVIQEVSAEVPPEKTDDQTEPPEVSGMDTTFKSEPVKETETAEEPPYAAPDAEDYKKVETPSTEESENPPAEIEEKNVEVGEAIKSEAEEPTMSETGEKLEKLSETASAPVESQTETSVETAPASPPTAPTAVEESEPEQAAEPQVEAGAAERDAKESVEESKPVEEAAAAEAEPTVEPEPTEMAESEPAEAAEPKLAEAAEPEASEPAEPEKVESVEESRVTDHGSSTEKEEHSQKSEHEEVADSAEKSGSAEKTEVAAAEKTEPAEATGSPEAAEEAPYPTSESDGETMHGGNDPDNVADGVFGGSAAVVMKESGAGDAVPYEGSVISVLDDMDCVDLNNIALNKIQMTEMSSFVAEHGHIKNISLRNTNMEPKDLERLACAIVDSDSEVEVLNLSSNRLTRDSIGPLMLLLRDKPCIKIIILEGNHLGDEGVLKLMECLQVIQDEIQMWRKMEWKHRRAEQQSSKEGETGEKEGKEDEEEEIEPYSISSESVEDVEVDRQHFSQLQELDLGSTGMTDIGVTEVGRLLESNFGLQTLGLSHNPGITIEGWTCIARGLKKNHKLHTLSLGHNNLGDEVIDVLVNGLKENSSLQVLDLEHTNIGERGAERLLKLIQVNSSIKGLTLTPGNNIPSELLKEIQNSLELN